MLLLQRLPDVVNMEDFSRQDLAGAGEATPTTASAAVGGAGKVEQLLAENQALQSRVQALQRQQEGGGVTEKEALVAEIDRLKNLTQSASKVSFVTCQRVIDILSPVMS